MAVSIPQLNTASGGDTFSILYSKINTMANAFSTVVMSASANATGGSTSGNAVLSGIFAATIIAPGSLRGGNVGSSDTLPIISNVNVTGDVFYVGNSSVNTAINSTSITVNTAFVANLQVSTLALSSALTLGQAAAAYVFKQTNAAVNQIVDSFLLSDIRSCEYFFSISDNNSNNVQASKAAIIHDGSNAYMTEYGIIASNGAIGTFSVTTNATAVIVSFLPNSTNTSIRAIRSSLKV